MLDRSLKGLITTGRFTLPIAFVLAMAGWALSGGWETGWPLPCTLLTAYLLVLLNNFYSLIRVRASLQSSCYLLLTGCLTQLHHPGAGWSAGIAFLLSFFFFFRSYRHPEPQASLFHSFLMLGTAILFWPPLALLVPFYWIGAWHFSVFHLRSFAATLTGLLTAFGCYFSYGYCAGILPACVRHLVEGTRLTTPSWSDATPWQWGVLGFLLALFVISAIHLSTHSYDEKLSTRSRLHFLMYMHLLLFLMGLLQPAWIATLLCLLPIGVSILSGHYFILSRGRLARIFFLATLCLLICIFITGLWIRG